MPLKHILQVAFMGPLRVRWMSTDDNQIDSPSCYMSYFRLTELRTVNNYRTGEVTHEGHYEET